MLPPTPAIDGSAAKISRARASQSLGGTASASRKARSSPEVASIPALRAPPALRRVGFTRTRAPAFRATAADASEEASSTTRTSSGDSLWPSAEPMASATVRAASRQGMITLVRMNHSVYPAVPAGPLGPGVALTRIR